MTERNTKCDKWLTEEGLTLLSAWARDGLTDEQIAHNMGVSVRSLYNYKSRFPQIATALKVNKEVADIQVENALYKAAIEGNITAQIFWLKNRQGEKWRDNRDLKLGGDLKTTGTTTIKFEGELDKWSE